MSKKFTTVLGGKEREFRYTMADREAIEDRFNMGMLEWLQQHILPTDAQGRTTGGGRFASQVALIHIGLKHHGGAVTEARVRQWLDEEQKSKKTIFEVITAAFAAVMVSGVLGHEVELGGDGDDDTGKGSAGETPAP